MALSRTIAQRVSHLLEIWQLNDYLHIQAGLFPHIVIKTAITFYLKLRLRPSRLKDFCSSKWCDFTCVIRDAAHLHRNECVHAGPHPQRAGVLTTTTGFGLLAKTSSTWEKNTLLPMMVVHLEAPRPFRGIPVTCSENLADENEIKWI